MYPDISDVSCRVWRIYGYRGCFHSLQLSNNISPPTLRSSLSLKSRSDAFWLSASSAYRLAVFNVRFWSLTRSLKRSTVRCNSMLRSLSSSTSDVSIDDDAFNTSTNSVTRSRNASLSATTVSICDSDRWISTGSSTGHTHDVDSRQMWCKESEQRVYNRDVANWLVITVLPFPRASLPRHGVACNPAFKDSFSAWSVINWTAFPPNDYRNVRCRSSDRPNRPASNQKWGRGAIAYRRVLFSIFWLLLGEVQLCQ